LTIFVKKVAQTRPEKQCILEQILLIIRFDQFAAFFSLLKQLIQIAPIEASIDWPQSLSIGEHTFKIEFEFESSGYLRPLPLLDGSITRSLAAGSNNVSFAEGDYNDPPDTDGDGKNNVDEVVDLDNPFTCVIGTSHIGDCQL
jgi:hypothetical protein